MADPFLLLYGRSSGWLLPDSKRSLASLAEKRDPTGPRAPADILPWRLWPSAHSC